MRTNRPGFLYDSCDLNLIVCDLDTRPALEVRDQFDTIYPSTCVISYFIDLGGMEGEVGCRRN